MATFPLNDEYSQRYYLYPGEIFASKKPHIVDTVLGSCVAVYLWDHVLKYAAINHYMLPSTYKPGEQSCKYGNIAIATLIDRLVKMGSDKKNLRAKLFGGSETARTNPAYNIGERNIIIAKSFLKKEDIPILSHSLGGRLSRKIIFYSHTGEVFVNFINHENKTGKQPLLFNPNTSRI